MAPKNRLSIDDREGRTRTKDILHFEVGSLSKADRIRKELQMTMDVNEKMANNVTDCQHTYIDKLSDRDSEDDEKTAECFYEDEKEKHHTGRLFNVDAIPLFAIRKEDNLLREQTDFYKSLAGHNKATRPLDRNTEATAQNLLTRLGTEHAGIKPQGSIENLVSLQYLT